MGTFAVRLPPVKCEPVKRNPQLSLQTVRERGNGQLAIGVYALNPKTQRSRWVAIDADYENRLEDLLTLQ